jgi:hypothetical protein
LQQLRSDKAQALRVSIPKKVFKQRSGTHTLSKLKSAPFPANPASSSGESLAGSPFSEANNGG